MATLKLNGVFTDDAGNVTNVDYPLQQVVLTAPTPEPAPPPPVEPPPVVVAPPVVVQPEPAPVPQPVVSSIPLSEKDPRFALNTPGSKTTVKNATYNNKTWNDNFSSGTQCFVWEGNGSDVLTLSQCYVNGREGPRIGAGSTSRATLNIDQTFINVVGKGSDHADCIQAYSPRGQCLLNIANSCLRFYDDAEAKQKYGSGFIGSAGLFWADDMQGEVRITNSVIWGGGRGVCIYADTGTTRVSFKNVFFVPGPDGWAAWAYDIRATGGKLEIVQWENVCEAKIEGGKPICVKQIPRP